jgi:hypothetical protein
MAAWQVAAAQQADVKNVEESAPISEKSSISERQIGA